MVQNNFKQAFSLPHTPNCRPSTALGPFCFLFCPIGLLVPSSLWYSQEAWSRVLAPFAGYPQSFWSLSAGTESKVTRNCLWEKKTKKQLKSLDGLYVVGREETLAAVFAETPPPGFVHCFHVHDDVPRFKRNLCVILWKAQRI